LRRNAVAITQQAIQVVGHLPPVQKLAEGQSGFAALFQRIETDLETLKMKLVTAVGSARCRRWRYSASAERSNFG
jgi:hypothetical protein